MSEPMKPMTVDASNEAVKEVLKMARAGYTPAELRQEAETVEAYGEWSHLPLLGYSAETLRASADALEKEISDCVKQGNRVCRWLDVGDFLCETTEYEENGEYKAGLIFFSNEKDCSIVTDYNGYVKKMTGITITEVPLNVIGFVNLNCEIRRLVEGLASLDEATRIIGSAYERATKGMSMSGFEQKSDFLDYLEALDLQKDQILNDFKTLGSEYEVSARDNLREVQGGSENIPRLYVTVRHGGEAIAYTFDLTATPEKNKGVTVSYTPHYFASNAQSHSSRKWSNGLQNTQSHSSRKWFPYGYIPAKEALADAYRCLPYHNAKPYTKEASLVRFCRSNALQVSVKRNNSPYINIESANHTSKEMISLHVENGKIDKILYRENGWNGTAKPITNSADLGNTCKNGDLIRTVAQAMEIFNAEDTRVCYNERGSSETHELLFFSKYDAQEFLDALPKNRLDGYVVKVEEPYGQVENEEEFETDYDTDYEDYEG